MRKIKKLILGVDIVFFAGLILVAVMIYLTVKFVLESSGII